MDARRSDGEYGKTMMSDWRGRGWLSRLAGQSRLDKAEGSQDGGDMPGVPFEVGKWAGEAFGGSGSKCHGQERTEKKNKRLKGSGAFVVDDRRAAGFQC